MPRISRYQLHTIETGRFSLDGGAMFGIVPRALWQKSIAPDANNRIPMHMRCLLLEGDGRLILVDNGIGTKYPEKFGKMFAVDDTSMNLNKSLAALGFNESDVTDVILTHLHFDHCGGSTRRNGDRLEVAFPNATFHVQRSHWAWAEKSNVREKASFLAENLEPLAASGQLNLLDGSSTLYPGIDLISVDGHTRAMQLVKIHDEKATLLFVADLLPTSSHLMPAWNMAYDLWPMTTIEEKAKILEQAITGDWKLFFEHDAAVELTDVEMGDRGPIIINARSLSEF